VYEVTTLLGSGGMGEVYRARDTKLGRDVALKILPEAFAIDAERVARFKREAQVLASLNHPNIGAIYGFEDGDGVHALVLELVDGPTLADRIAQGPMPVDEALPIAKQIAEALEAAHEQGIVHRDLKPANIKVRADGAVKVLDFGLAKLAEPAAVAGMATLTQSPTITTPAMTAAGMILGTAAYMSPEQAKGRPADKRSDIWAFGCVLFEMLTARRAFQGADVSDTLAAILRGEPDWRLLPAVPRPVVRVLHRALAKEPRRRLANFADIRLDLDETSEATDTEPAPLTRWLAIAALVALAAASGAAALMAKRPATAADTPMRFTTTLGVPDKTSLSMGLSGPIGGTIGPVISPDGMHFAFTAQDGTGRVQLWLRPADSLAARSLNGTDNAALPFWSPDSRSIGFFADGLLKRVDVATVTVQTLCRAEGLGATWSRDDTILFSHPLQGSLWRVPAAGGSPVQVTTPPGENQILQRFPTFLPDGNHFLFWQRDSRGAEPPHVLVGALRGGPTKRILDADSAAVLSASGDLLFVREGALFAQPFDTARLEVRGQPHLVVDHVASDAMWGLAAFAVSDTGTLVYRTGRFHGQPVRLTWVNREGHVLGEVGAPASYRGLEFAPDDHRLAFHRHDGDGGDLWIANLANGTTARLTFDAATDNSSPVWSHDGQHVLFSSRRHDKWGIYEKRADGTSEEHLIYEAENALTVSGLSRDDQLVLFAQNGGLWVVPRDGGAAPRLIAAPAVFGQVSPNGRWVAYTPAGGVANGVFVQPFPSGAGRWQVSTDGGTWPRWSGDGKELFYLTRTNLGRMTVVDVTESAASIQFGQPRDLFEAEYFNLGPHARNAVFSGVGYETYAVTHDGQRFLIPRAADATEGAATMNIVLHWNANSTR
jgi:Tol biopolymer transport system component